MQRPRISTNLAISADGKISSPGHRPSNWTSEEDLQRLKDLRRDAQALMVGRGTADTDRMTLRVEGDGLQPLRCIISHYGELAADHPVFSVQGGDIHLLATQGYRGDSQNSATIHESSLTDFLQILYRDHKIEHLHCEGGGQLIRELAQLDAIDEFHLTLAGHTLLGGKNSPTATGTLESFLPAARTFEITSFEHHADIGECFLTYRRQSS